MLRVIICALHFPCSLKDLIRFIDVLSFYILKGNSLRVISTEPGIHSVQNIELFVFFFSFLHALSPISSLNPFFYPFLLKVLTFLSVFYLIFSTQWTVIQPIFTPRIKLVGCFSLHLKGST